MSSLRSNFLLAMLSVLVMAAFGSSVLHLHCGEKAQQSHTANSDKGKRSSEQSAPCQCLCHQVFFAHCAEPLRVGSFYLVTSEFTPSVDEVPPDSLPVGIEYPPQLA